METFSSSPASSRKLSSAQKKVSFWHVALALCALGLGCFFGLGNAGIFDLDEGYYATVARQMVESGNYIVPRVGMANFYDKPPLFYWLETIGIHLFGATPFAVRLPSAMAAALTAIALWAWCRKRGQERVGWMAGAFYVFCPLTGVLAHEAVLDALLTLWLTLAMIFAIEAYGAEDNSGKKNYFFMAVAVGLAVMTKGVIGVLLPLVTLGVWLLLRRDGNGARRVPWVGAAVIVALIIAPWHLLMWRATGQEFVREYIVHNHIQRFRGEDFKHNAPFWAYLPILLGGLFPWSVWAPLGWWKGFQARTAPRASFESALAMWALWAAVVVVFFSLSKSKLPSYVQPAVPALCLLVAARIDFLWREKLSSGKAEGFALGFVGFLLSAALLFVGAKGWQWRGETSAAFGGKPLNAQTFAAILALSPTLLLLGAVLLAGSAAMLWSWKAPLRVAKTGTLMGAGLIAVLAGVGLPAWNALDVAPVHDLARQTLPALERGENLILYRLKPGRPSVRFVVGHPSQVFDTNDADVLRATLERKNGGWILAAKSETLPPLPFSLRQQSESGRWALWKCEPSTGNANAGEATGRR